MITNGVTKLARTCRYAVLLSVVSLHACAGEMAIPDNTITHNQPSEISNVLADGALWVASVPANWNGTLLLYSHGYSRTLVAPNAAPEKVKALLLAQGYALAASQYPSSGWAVAGAVPSQLLVLSAFNKHFGKPKRVIAWGDSMGGLITTALAEKHSDQIDGAITMCASNVGALPMMNMGLDGAFTLSTLIAPELAFSPVGRGDNFAQVKQVLAAMHEARKTPLGRARVALAGVMAGLPGWSIEDTEMPSATDFDEQERQIANAMLMGTFLPRGDQESRAGGVFSWNLGIDYQQLLASSGRADLVNYLYAQAGVKVEDDLALLAKAPRVSASPQAVQYMQDNFTPSGDLKVPLFSMHTIGDGMTSPAMQFAYARQVQAKTGSDNVLLAWIKRAGHCSQNEAEMVAAIHALETKLETGDWHRSVAELNKTPVNGVPPAFMAYQPFTLPRKCLQYPNQCADFGLLTEQK